MKKIIIFCTFFVFPNAFNGQNQYVLDSLIALSKTVYDTARANLYIDVCQNAMYINPNVSVDYANKLIQFGEFSSNIKYSVRGNEIIGIYYFVNSNLDSSLFYFEKAKIIANRNKLYQQEARLYFRISFVYVAKNDDEKSLKSILKAIQIEQAKTSKIFLSEYKNKLGSIFLSKKDYINASKYFNEAINDDKYNDIKSLGYIYQNLAWMAKEKNDLKKSFQYLRLSNIYLLEQKEYRALSANYEIFYSNYMNLNQFDSAYYYNKKFEKYARICSMPSNIFSAHLNYSLLNLIYFKNIKLAKMYLDSASHDSVTIQLPGYRLVFLEQTFLYEIGIGDFVNGYFHFNLYFRLKDSLLSNENLSIVQNLNVKYETEKKELQLRNQSIEIDFKENENQRKSTIILFGALGLFASATFGTMAFINFRKSKKANLIINSQKLEVELKNEEISHQKELVEEKQKEILDSINYAKRIQYSLLASNKLLNENLPNHFLFFKPKDVVSGDFYWGCTTPSPSGKTRERQFLLVTADSTGHGVPGAIMSMLNISCLNEAINADNATQPAEILNATRKKIIEHLSNDGSAEGGKDGMDCSLISFDFISNKLTYAAANNPIWIIRTVSSSIVGNPDKHEFISLAADRMPIGKHDKDSISFTQHEFDLQSGDMVYTLTDGFPDQFGGPKGKKFKYKQLEDLLVSICHESMENQKQKLEDVFENWKGNLEQIDDVCIIGIRI